MILIPGSISRRQLRITISTAYSVQRSTILLVCGLCFVLVWLTEAAGYGRFLDYLSDCELAGEMPPRWTHHPYPVTVHALQTSLVLGPGRVRPGQPVSDYAFQVARLLQTTNLGLVPEDATRLAKAKQINAALNEKWFGEGTPEGEGNFKENYAAIENVCAEERERGDWESLAPTLVEPYQ